MIYNITPVAKPRQTRSDKWKKRPAVLKYRAFADKCRLKGVKVDNGCEITFYMPMPKSWSNVNKSMMAGAGHKKRPDVDNLLKAVMDAVLPEDSHIHEISVKKVWAINGAIEIKLLEG